MCKRIVRARTLPCSIGRRWVIEDLRSLLGGERVLTEPAVLAAHSRESWPLRLVQAARGWARGINCRLDPRPYWVAGSGHHGPGGLGLRANQSQERPLLWSKMWEAGGRRTEGSKP
jgi:hypothetical protein